MKTITKKYLEEEIKNIKEINLIMNSAAGANPFAQSINLEEQAKELLKNAEDRVGVEIWQKHRITVLEGLLKELD